MHIDIRGFVTSYPLDWIGVRFGRVGCHGKAKIIHHHMGRPALTIGSNTCTQSETPMSPIQCTLSRVPFCASMSDSSRCISSKAQSSTLGSISLATVPSAGKLCVLPDLRRDLRHTYHLPQTLFFFFFSSPFDVALSSLLPRSSAVGSSTRLKIAISGVGAGVHSTLIGWSRESFCPSNHSSKRMSAGPMRTLTWYSTRR